jgi:hypothetical protein
MRNTNQGWLKWMLTLIALSYTATSAASNGGPLFPSFITTKSNGIAFVYFTGARTGAIPSCVANGGTYFRFAFDTTTAGGRSMLANIMAAHAAGALMWFQGSGDCSVDISTEALAEIHTDS